MLKKLTKWGSGTGLRLLAGAVITVGSSAAITAPAWADQAELERKVDVLAEELARLREELAIPETDDQLRGQYGMGPAASKVYGVRQGISLGGYGEFYFAAPIEQTDETGAVNTADYYRFISYVGYKFSDSIVMNTEIEFEHATTSANYAGSGGSVSVEFAYLDFLLDPKFNVRAGNLLVPIGFVNEMHEPPFYRGNFRPDLERTIIPSTWRELGVGAHGQLSSSVRYTAYLLNGLNGEKFGTTGIRSGRQSGNRVLYEDVAIAANLAWEPSAEYGLSGSAYYGGADQNRIVNAMDESVDVSNWITEAHAYYQKNGLEARALFVVAGISEVEALSEILGRTIPKRQMGWYVDVAYDVAPYLLGRDTTVRVSPWVRYENLDLQNEVGDGFTANDALARQVVSAGVDVKPHPQVVLKGEYVKKSNDGDAVESDEIRVGAGFVF